METMLTRFVVIKATTWTVIIIKSATRTVVETALSTRLVLIKTATRAVFIIETTLTRFVVIKATARTVVIVKSAARTVVATLFVVKTATGTVTELTVAKPAVTAIVIKMAFTSRLVAIASSLFVSFLVTVTVIEFEGLSLLELFGFPNSGAHTLARSFFVSHLVIMY
jgi:hypothetical protein